jgi:hypothetical protein
MINHDYYFISCIHVILRLFFGFRYRYSGLQRKTALLTHPFFMDFHHSVNLAGDSLMRIMYFFKYPSSRAQRWNGKGERKGRVNWLGGIGGIGTGWTQDIKDRVAYFHFFFPLLTFITNEDLRSERNLTKNDHAEYDDYVLLRYHHILPFRKQKNAFALLFFLSIIRTHILRRIALFLPLRAHDLMPTNQDSYHIKFLYYYTV